MVATSSDEARDSPVARGAHALRPTSSSFNEETDAQSGSTIMIFERPVLTGPRVRLAYAIAVMTDVVQFLLGPFGWAFADEILDLVAMVATWRLLGFHPLLLPTFALEFLPIADMLPTWTACVAIVIALRQRQEVEEPPGPGPVIDV
jgi:hypothetical protein